MFVGFTEAFSADELGKQLDINVVGIHRVNRAFLPAMRQDGKGLIINISSTAGRAAVPFFGVYHASKWGLEGYSLALRGELASSGVDVVVVEPGPFTTALFPSSPRPEDAEGRVATYPAAAHQTFEQMGAAFEGLFQDPEAQRRRRATRRRRAGNSGFGRVRQPRGQEIRLTGVGRHGSRPAEG
jgi:short-subunit dehydrogenase